MANQNLTQKRARDKGRPARVQPPLVALYARVSTDEQAQEGVSIDAQLKALRAWGKLKGWQIAGEYVDEGYSGTTDNRPNFQRLMLDAKRGQCNVVAVAKLDRFMRNTRLFHKVIYDLEGLGVAFVSIQEGINTLDSSGTVTGHLFLNILAAFAEFESARIGERVKDARRQLVSKGRWPAGRALYGYRWNKEAGKFEVVEAEAEVVGKIFELYVNGNIGQIQIAAKLYEDGYRTRPIKGYGYAELQPRTWGPRGVSEILRDCRYTGMDENFSYPPIISEPIFSAAQRKRREARHILRNANSWLLQGRVVCGLCGHRVSPRQWRKSGRRVYECYGRKKQVHLDGSSRCSLSSIPAEPLEVTVWHHFAQAASNGELLRQSIERSLAELEQRRKQLGDDGSIDRELEKIRGRKERLWDAYEEGGMPKDRFLAKVTEFDQKVKELEARRDRLNPTARLEIAKLEDYIEAVRRILAQDSIRIADYGVTGTLVDEDERGPYWLDHDLHDLWDGKEPDLKPAFVEGADGERRYRIPMNFHQMKLQRKRRLLETFDVTVKAFPERIEVNGLIPTHIIERKGAQVNGSSCRSESG